MQITPSSPEKPISTIRPLEDRVRPNSYLGVFANMDVMEAEAEIDFHATHEYKAGLFSSVAVVIGSALIFSAVSYVLEQFFPEYF